MNKRRGRAGSQKYFNYENNYKQNKAMKKQDYDKLWLWDRNQNFAVATVAWEVGIRILQWMRVNQETKYCGEVISDDVQLWTETGDMCEPNVTGEKHDKNLKRIWKHDQETENKTVKT